MCHSRPRGYGESPTVLPAPTQNRRDCFHECRFQRRDEKDGVVVNSRGSFYEGISAKALFGKEVGAVWEAPSVPSRLANGAEDS